MVTRLRAGLNLGIIFVVLVLIVVVVVLIGRDAAAPTEENSAQTAASSPIAGDSQEDAIQKLKAALDGWILGDDQEKMNSGYPDYTFLAGAPLFQLQRYDLGPTRLIPNKGKVPAYETSVTLYGIEGTSGRETRKVKKYMSFKNPKDPKDKRWHMIG